MTIQIDTTRLPRNNCLCIDMKSYYSSLECVSRGLDPLTTYLVVVGDLDRTGSVVLASSPPMKREYKIKTGSRLYEVPKDPKIRVVQARMGYYLENTTLWAEILKRYAPIEAITIYSVDEGFITTDGSEGLFGDKWSVAQQIQRSIRMELGLPCAIGIGDNYFQAKVALDNFSKNNADSGYMAALSYDNFAEKAWPLPIKEIWGIGSRMEKNLNRLGIYLLGDLAKFPLEKLKRRWGVMGEQLYYHSHGIDLTKVFHKPDMNEHKSVVQKGFGSGITLLRDYFEVEEILAATLDQIEEVARRARKVKMAGRTISLSIGYSQDVGGGGFSHAKTIEIPTNVTMKIYEVCKKMFEQYYNGQVVRLIHVSLTNLQQDEIVQLDMFENNQRERELGYVMDAIKQKYGSTSIIRARSLTAGGTILNRAGKIGGHNA